MANPQFLASALSAVVAFQGLVSLLDLVAKNSTDPEANLKHRKRKGTQK